VCIWACSSCSSCINMWHDVADTVRMDLNKRYSSASVYGSPGCGTSPLSNQREDLAAAGCHTKVPF